MAVVQSFLGRDCCRDSSQPVKKIGGLTCSLPDGLRYCFFLFREILEDFCPSSCIGEKI
jgi:hypothetical protein